MRRPLIAGNWKMFKTVAETRHLVSELVPGLQAIAGVEKAICPPYTALLAASALLEGLPDDLGAEVATLRGRISAVDAYDGPGAGSIGLRAAAYVF